MGPKKLALWFLIVSVAISAVLGIIAILTSTFGWLQVRIVLTTLTISAASICALASGALWESGDGRVLPAAGIVLALLAAILIVTGIWTEAEAEPFWKFTASVGVLAAATAHTCLLSLAKLAPRFAWASLTTFIAIYLLALLIVVSIYVEPEGDLGFRLIGATAIVVAALTIMTPIFHRLSREDLSHVANKREPLESVLFATITCPQCGASQPNSLTERKCDRCGCQFVLKILAEGRLPNNS
jgi:hypothetical protein